MELCELKASLVYSGILEKLYCEILSPPKGWGEEGVFAQFMKAHAVKPDNPHGGRRELLPASLSCDLHMPIIVYNKRTNKQTKMRGWTDSSAMHSTVALTKTMSSVLSTHMVVHFHFNSNFRAFYSLS